MDGLGFITAGAIQWYKAPLFLAYAESGEALSDGKLTPTVQPGTPKEQTQVLIQRTQCREDVAKNILSFIQRCDRVTTVVYPINTFDM